MREPVFQHRADAEHRVVAIGLLSERDLSVLGQGFKHSYRIDEVHHFNELLAAIDAAERSLESD